MWDYPKTGRSQLPIQSFIAHPMILSLRNQSVDVGGINNQITELDGGLWGNALEYESSFEDNKLAILGNKMHEKVYTEDTFRDYTVNLAKNGPRLSNYHPRLTNFVIPFGPK